MSAEEQSGTQSALQYDEGNCFQYSMKECNGITLLFTWIWNIISHQITHMDTTLNRLDRINGRRWMMNR